MTNLTNFLRNHSKIEIFQKLLLIIVLISKEIIPLSLDHPTNFLQYLLLHFLFKPSNRLIIRKLKTSSFLFFRITQKWKDIIKTTVPKKLLLQIFFLKKGNKIFSPKVKFILSMTTNSFNLIITFVIILFYRIIYKLTKHYLWTTFNLF